MACWRCCYSPWAGGRLFRAAGIDAHPAATDFEIHPVPNYPLRWLPDAEALYHSTRALSAEDYCALRTNGIGGIGTLAWKNLSKLGQFVARPE